MIENNKENQKLLKDIILNYIWENYGKSEENNPCYDINKLSKYILNRIEFLKRRE